MANTLSYLLTCGRVIKDQTTQFFTYLDVFDVLVIPKGNEFLIQSFWIAGKLYLDTSGKVEAKIKFIYPDGTESAPSSVNGIVNPGYLQITAYFNMIKFTQIGRYHLKINFQGEDLETSDKFYFEVVKQP